MASHRVGIDSTHEDRPNVVLLTAHDMGRELGCYGRQAYTPRLDALAENGVSFQQHFCTTPHCAPSRASLATGLQPHNHGMMGHPYHTEHAISEVFDNPAKGWEIDEGIPTLAMRLRNRGYDTHLTHSGVHSSKHTFGHEHLHRNPDISGMPDGPEAADLVEQILHEDVTSDTPFFVEVSTINSHSSYFTSLDRELSDQIRSKYDGPRGEDIDISPYLGEDVDAFDGFDETTMRNDFENFYEVMYELDHAVGRILDTLEETGYREHTLFIFASDHGISFVPNGKGTCYDRGIEASLLMQYPGRIEGVEHQETLTSHVDVLPTVLDFVDGRAPTDVDGRSLRPLIDGTDNRSYSERNAIFAEKTYFGSYDPVRVIRTDEFKLIRNCWPRGYENSPRTRSTEVELYDLQENPHERDNLADDPRYTEVRTELSRQLQERLRADTDPLVNGPIPPKSGAFDVRI